MRLIDADAFLAGEIKRCHCVPCVGSCEKDYEPLTCLLAQEPSIDAVPVVYGRWEETDWREYDAQSGETIRYPKAALACTNCRCAFKKDALWSRNYCPNCGAKMDGGNGA